MAWRHVLDDHADVLYVTHDSDDGTWQFLCGAEHHAPEDAKMVSLGQVVVLDPTLNALHDMPLGYGATRSATNADWEPFKL